MFIIVGKKSKLSIMDIRMTVFTAFAALFRSCGAGNSAGLSVRDDT